MKTKIGIVGTGVISGIYLDNMTTVFKDELEVVAVCDLVKSKAEAAKAKYNIPKLYDTDAELFADPEIEIVLNLTRPYEHFEVTKAALLAGKHVYTEKPLGASFEEGKKLFDLAKEKGLQIAGAPDTFLGGGIQRCRQLIDDDVIGDVVGAQAFMVCRGHETWHEDPAFYYQYGGGPMMDMGPYYVTALLNLIGRVKTLTGMTKISFPTRTITSQPLNGTVVKVDVPTYITGLMEFENGAVGSIFTTFDVYTSEVPRIEIFGSKGTLSVPDPNYFEGPIRLFKPETGAFEEVPVDFPYQENSRGLGVLDMARAFKAGETPRANMEQLLHTLEILTSFQVSSESKKQVVLSTEFDRSKAFNV